MLERGGIFLSLLSVLAVGCRLVPGGPVSDEAVWRGRRPSRVELVRHCLPSAVDLTAPRQGGSYGVFGSGTIVHEAGYILTNNYVTGHGKLTARLHNGKSHPCRVVAQMPEEELAVLKIDTARPLKPFRIGRSHDLMLGESVLVIGNPSLPHTVSTGIISGLNRHVQVQHGFAGGIIQTNAAINDGSPGGPLVNVLGELIAVVRGVYPGGENVGFATGIDHIRKVFAERLSIEQRGVCLGLTVDSLGPAKVTQVLADSPAAKAGVEVGDIIRQVGNMRVRNAIHFHLALLERKAGEELTLALQRGKKAVTVTATLEKIAPRPAGSDKPG